MKKPYCILFICICTFLWVSCRNTHVDEAPVPTLAVTPIASPTSLTPKPTVVPPSPSPTPLPVLTPPFITQLTPLEWGRYTDGESEYRFDEKGSVFCYDTEPIHQQKTLIQKNVNIKTIAQKEGALSLAYHVCDLGDWTYRTMYAIAGGSGEHYGPSSSTMFRRNKITGEEQLIEGFTGASVVFHNDHFFFIEMDFQRYYFPTGKIYSMDKNMQNKKQLTQNTAAYDFFIMDDKIYYIDYKEDILYSVNLDGSENKSVAEGSLPEYAMFMFGDFGAGYSFPPDAAVSEMFYGTPHFYYGNHLFTYSSIRDGSPYTDIVAKLSFDKTIVLAEGVGLDNNFLFYGNVVWDDDMVVWRSWRPHDTNVFIYKAR